jgi:hypothetical protein
MSNQNTGNHNLTVSLIQQNTKLQNTNHLLLEALSTFQQIIKEIEVRELNFSQYVQLKKQEIDQVFLVFEDLKNNDNIDK